MRVIALYPGKSCAQDPPLAGGYWAHAARSYLIYLYDRNSRSASRCASFIACSGVRSGQCGLQAVVQRLRHALIVMRRQLRFRIRQLVARDRSRRKILHVLFHHRRFERGGRDGHVTRIDPPLCRALRLCSGFDERQRFALRRRLFLNR
jgi:hypothetical protein